MDQARSTGLDDSNIRCHGSLSADMKEARNHSQKTLGVIRKFTYDHDGNGGIETYDRR